MDLRFSAAQPSRDERRAVDAAIGPPRSGWDGGRRDPGIDGRVARGGLPAARSRRHLLLPALHAVQDRVGWISEGALQYICRRLQVPPAEAWGVVTFYDLFSTEPTPPVVAHVCDDLVCRALGASEICSQLERHLGAEGKPAREGRATWRRSPCLGQCERAPAALVVGAGEARQMSTLAPAVGVDPILRALEGDATELLSARRVRFATVRRSVPQAGDESLRLLRRVGVVDPTSLEAYRAADGYRALDRAISIGPERVVEEILTSRLVGRGGAAFPTGRKWQAVAGSGAGARYLVCNADESEPGTFKDRILLEEDPFAILEAMTIAAFACGCERGFVYLRGEYPLAEGRLRQAIEQARAAGFLGENVADAGFGFEVEIRRGAGAYICGEETALFNSIEGFRGEPRSKPPFPTESGLFGRPTVVNNVETLANVPWIVRMGGDAFAGIGTEGSTGTKLFCVSGHVERPGLYEAPFGATLGRLIELAGGVRAGAKLRAILLGGAAGAFVGPDALDTPLTFEGTREVGATLGSGVVLVYDESADLGDALLRIAAFFRHESCGQCVPCRVGTVRQEELLARLRDAGDGSRKDDLELLGELAQAMRDASICGLGQTASTAIESALERFDPFRPGPAAAKGKKPKRTARTGRKDGTKR